MDLTPVRKKFILHWGEMGSRWGINRTMAQIHALLYLSPQPLNAEQITHALQVARSNVSMSLRELQAWGVVRSVPVLGDRRDHFECMSDVWEMFQAVMDERKRRECDPTVQLLRQCIEEADRDRNADPLVRRRLADLHMFFDTMSNWYEQMRRLPTRSLISFVKMGPRVRKFLGLAS